MDAISRRMRADVVTPDDGRRAAAPDARTGPLSRRPTARVVGLVLALGSVSAAAACSARLPAPDGVGPPPGTVFRDCTTCPEMVVVPAGTFRMGSEALDPGRAGAGRPPWEVAPNPAEQPAHLVQVAAFAIGRYETTRAEYAAFIAATDHATTGGCEMVTDELEVRVREDASWRAPGFEQADRHPAVCVSWRDAQAYVAWLSAETGERYRLPSEAEWERAARAGTETQRYWGDGEADQCAYENGRTGGPGGRCEDGMTYTAPVGSYAANGFGLFDLLGNVREWVEDCWHDDYAGAPDDGGAWTTGGACGRRVVRGGSWLDVPAMLRAAAREGGDAGVRHNVIGFRVARSLE